jgi:transcriptional regulator with XRE-family HTH domain
MGLADADLTPFEQLTGGQQKAVLILASMSDPERNLTNEEIANKAGVTAETLSNWRTDPTFQQATLDLLLPAARFEASLMLHKYLFDLTKNGKARPEDRRLLAELAGIVGPQNSVSVSFNKLDWSIKPPK